MATLAYEPLAVDGPTKKMSPRILRAKFGDGYSQRAGDGINPIDEEYSCDWDHVDETEADALEAQFEGLYGVGTLTWTPPGESTAKKFTVPSWSRTYVLGEVYNYSKMRATLKLENDL